MNINLLEDCLPSISKYIPIKVFKRMPNRKIVKGYNYKFKKSGSFCL